MPQRLLAPTLLALCLLAPALPATARSLQAKGRPVPSSGPSAAAPASGATPRPEPRVRLRDLGVRIGQLPPGRWNAITDVAGVKVGHTTLVSGEGPLRVGVGPVRTGVTAIVPRDDVWRQKVFASGVVINGNGLLTALDWIKEAGCLETPIVLTDTLSVGRVSDAVVTWMMRRYPAMGIDDDVVLPCVGECDDGFLNDQRGRHVQEPHVLAALDGARSGPVEEGGVGAGTGMVAYRFKAGIGTASRVLPKARGGWTVGVLVNANMGRREDLRIAGVPVGERIQDLMPRRKPGEGSIIVVVATDAPLLPHQLERVARRAILGIGRTGSVVAHSSGDFAVAFSTAAVVPHVAEALTMPLAAVNNVHLTPLFAATVEATEEAIGNALTMASTTTGRDGHLVHALPLDRVRRLLEAAGQRPQR
ncbi:MAG: P1 family peptidase [Candidatus Sericytochromatia bacterium]|nr:P1 family peptidase [Candidatus Sericytochromatia bacterium]